VTAIVGRHVFIVSMLVFEKGKSIRTRQ